MPGHLRLHHDEIHAYVAKCGPKGTGNYNAVESTLKHCRRYRQVIVTGGILQRTTYVGSDDPASGFLALRLQRREIRRESSGEKSAAEEILGVTMRSKPSIGQKKPQRDACHLRRISKTAETS
jgi:hypothetical protein